MMSSQAIDIVVGSSSIHLNANGNVAIICMSAISVAYSPRVLSWMRAVMRLFIRESESSRP